MFQLFSGPTLYIKISSQRLQGLNAKTGEQFDEPPLVAIKRQGQQQIIHAFGYAARQYQGQTPFQVINPFEHPRQLLADFTCAEGLLRQVIKQIYHGVLRPQPRVILHPLEKLEGGLSQIEIRAFHELGRGCGARHVELWVGRELSFEELKQRTFPLQDGALLS